MMLNRRPMKIGGSINSRTEKHGDKDVPAFDIPISFMLERHELNEFMGDKVTFASWFNERPDGLPEPLHPQVKFYAVNWEFEDSTVSLYLGLKERFFYLEECTLTKFKLAPQVGGLTEMKVTVQVAVDEVNSALVEWLNKDGHCEVDIGKLSEKEKAKKRQPELPLNTFGDDDAGLKAAPKKRPRKDTHVN
jgi:hypothetical protein